MEVTSGWLSPIEDLFEKEPEVVAIQPKIKAWKDKEKFEYAGACLLKPKMTAESSGYRLYDGEQFDKRFPG